MKEVYPLRIPKDIHKYRSDEGKGRSEVVEDLGSWLEKKKTVRGGPGES